MNIRRIAALVAAIALVLVAFVARDAFDDSDNRSSNNSNSGPGGDPSAETDAPALETAGALICITELRSVCDQLADNHPDLDVTVEPAATTLERLAALAEPSDAPLWLTIEPFPAMAESMRGDATPIGFASTALASTPLGVAVPAGRGDVLVAACPAASLWPCIGDHAGDAWTDLGGEAAWSNIRPSLGDVERSALGLASFADAVAGFAGTPDFDEADWSGRIPALRALARASERAPNSGGSPLATMATGRAVDIAASAAAELAGLGAGSSRYELVYPEPGMWMQAALAVPTGADAPDGLAEETAALLATAGWQPPEDATVPLPPAPVLIQLRELWTELT